MRMRIFFALGCLALVACSDDVLRDGTVIGVVVDQTTAEADTGWTQAMELAAEQMNAALAADGTFSKRFVLRIRDSQGLASVVAEEALGLVRDQGAVALITDTTDTARAALALVYSGAAAVPVQCSSCTSTLLTDSSVTGGSLDDLVRRDADGWLFRTVADIGPMAVIMSRKAAELGDVNRDGLRKVAVYSADDDFGREASDAITAALMLGDGVSVPAGTFKVEQIMHRPGDANRVDYGRDISRLLDGNTEAVDGSSSEADGEPDVIVVASQAANHASFVAAYDATSSGAPVLHFYRFRQSGTLYQLGSIAEGVRGVSYVGTDGLSGRVFAKDFTRAYGFEPPALAATYYDNAVTLMLASLMSERTASSMRVALRDTSNRSSGAVQVSAGEDGLRAAILAIASGMTMDYTGASGPVDYDVNGDVRDRVASFEVRKNDFVETAVYDCVSEGSCGD